MSDKNRLNEGASRIGFLFDGLPETPHVAVNLEKASSDIRLTLPYLREYNDQHQRWFMGNAHWGDDPDKSKHRYEPPDTLDFYDANGPVGLVGCSSRGWTEQLAHGIGQGSVSVDFAIMGASRASLYRDINGFRSEIEGLGTWVGLRSLDAQQSVDDEGRLESVSLVLKAPEPIALRRQLNASVRPSWRYSPGPGPDQTTISERMLVQTDVRKARPWEDHFGTHFAVRNLLRIAVWRRLNLVDHEVSSDRDPVRMLDGSTRGRQWLPVITFRTGISSERSTRLSSLDFLFSFDDVGAGGVSRWIELSDMLNRGLSPLVGLLDLQGATLEAHLAQAGIGFESLGHDLLIANGASRSRAAESSFEVRLRAVTSPVGSVLPFDENAFVDAFRSSYRSVKHADNAVPVWRDLMLTYLQSVQVFRAWVGNRVGVSAGALRISIERDAITRHIRDLEAASHQ